MSIHSFCDASQVAFGACIYVRSASSDGQFETHLSISESRVAPLRAKTIPRLELCGALLLAELLSDVKSELGLLNISIIPSDVHLWTDFTIILAWIMHLGNIQTYVAKRIARIHVLTTPTQWWHGPTADNSADLITRGIGSDAISLCAKWWHGLDWLSFSEDHWPIYVPPSVDALP